MTKDRIAAAYCTCIRITTSRLREQGRARRPPFTKTACYSNVSAKYQANSREWSTALAKNLAEAILTTGPISIAKYMRECLTSPNGGYYTTRDADSSDQFGKAGDFTTSPEISQIFGELVGIWFLTEWMSQGRVSTGVELIELGPGRGTLMADMLRTISRFGSMASAVTKVHLVEASPVLRVAQHRFLCGDAPLQQLPSGEYESISKHLPHVPVIWHEDVSILSNTPSAMPFVVAHEFFDALPIHTFSSVPLKHRSPRQRLTTSSVTPISRAISSTKHSNEWRELLVSTTAPPSRLDIPRHPEPEFELSISPAPTAHSRLLPSLSPRYDALLDQTDATIEICPEARTIVTALSKLIGGEPKGNMNTRYQSTSEPNSESSGEASGSGAMLLIDYGPASTIPINTLRGIHNHRICSPFDAPGRVDLSADVDFEALVETALAACENVTVHGPTEQGDWLETMGGKQRCESLLAQANSKQDGDAAARIAGGWNRLTNKGPDGMGKVYKIMSIIPGRSKRRPVGFGGVVEG